MFYKDREELFQKIIQYGYLIFKTHVEMLLYLFLDFYT